jgi:hypothetical protein
LPWRYLATKLYISQQRKLAKARFTVPQESRQLSPPKPTHCRILTAMQPQLISFSQFPYQSRIDSICDQTLSVSGVTPFVGLPD